MISEEIDGMLHSVKIIVLLEQEPLSDKFDQVMLTLDQFKAFTEFMSGLFRQEVHGDHTDSVVTTSDRFKGIYIQDVPTSYTQEQLDSPLS